MTSFGHSTAAEPLVGQAGRPALRVRAIAATVGLASVALAVAVVPHAGASGGAVVRAAAVAIPVALGLYRLSREAEDRFAIVLLAAGAVLALTTLAETGDSTAYSIGRIAAWLIEPLLVFLLLAFPHGRLEPGRDRRLVVSVALLATVLYLPTALLAPFPEPSPWAPCGTACPSNALQLNSGSPAVVQDVLVPARELLTFLLFAAVWAALARRASRAGSITRRILMPVVTVAFFRALALGMYVLLRRMGATSAVTASFGWLYIMSLPLLTLAFVSGLLTNRLFVAGALERLTGSLSARPSLRGLRTGLANALMDPALQLLYWVPERGGWIDDRGQEAPSPEAAPGRTLTEVAVDGRLLGVIVHEQEVVRDPALLNAATSYVVSALDHEQLVARLRSSLDELTESRQRLVTVADEERRKIERDLHDGAQQRLIALQIKLELLAERLDDDSPENARRARQLEEDIAETLDEVRRFGRGVYPPLLADRGLRDALHAVARTAAIPTTVDTRLAQRYPREVESAVYFACLEGLQNAAKHAAGATGVTIAVSANGQLRFEVRDDGAGFDPAVAGEGAGLTNLRDRIGALGGSVQVASAPGRGTRVTGTIPLR